ncbi:copper resistance protein CopB [Alcanivorax sp. N3-2A]|nr:copper resistance protein CopB [Alcanivorax sp. N3-2A]|tara:strand:+ start:2342 stop:3058 length:717 start_codon:yes stop_codon:yes gene_type:complete
MKIGLMLATAVTTLIALPVHAMDKTEPRFTRVLIDQLEVRDADQGMVGAWDASAWYGGDINKLYLASEGERLMEHEGETESFETRAAWSHAFSPFWDWKLGARRDWQPDHPNRDWASVGLQGLAPYWFETSLDLFIGERGLSNLRLEAEYDLLLTQRLILAPEIETNLYGKEDTDLGVGAGLTDIELGLRLRYEIRREFAPYIGLHWQRQFGDTAGFTRERGGEVEQTTLVAGFRIWF